MTASGVKYSAKEIKRVYRASFNAKIAKTISLAHVGPRAQDAFRQSLPQGFHTEQPFALKKFLEGCSTGEKLSTEPSLPFLRKYWHERAEKNGLDLKKCRTVDELAKELGVARIKIMATPGCMDATRENHFRAWLKAIYQDLFPVKARAKKLSDQLYGIKHEFLETLTPVGRHLLPSGEIRTYYEIEGWGFHGDRAEELHELPLTEIPDFAHLNLSPRQSAYHKDPWEDVLTILKWPWKDRLGEEFFTAAHDDFQDWLSERQQSTEESVA
jgi:hypothetical protein